MGSEIGVGRNWSEDSRDSLLNVALMSLASRWTRLALTASGRRKSSSLLFGNAMLYVVCTCQIYVQILVTVGLSREALPAVSSRDRLQKQASIMNERAR
jgi:hypothetical protein